MAQRKGFLEREGIDLEVVGLRGTQYQIEELDKRNVDISHTATPYLIQAVLNGSPSVGIVGAAANTIYSLIAQPQIRPGNYPQIVDDPPDVRAVLTFFKKSCMVARSPIEWAP